MKVKVDETDTALVIRLEGEMMLGYEANDFQEAVHLGLEKHKKTIVVDLCEVRTITSWGIGILMHGYTTAANAGGSLKLSCVPENIKEIFKKIKVDQIFPQYETVEEALKM
jgi:anti-anti-sigma factor